MKDIIVSCLLASVSAFCYGVVMSLTCSLTVMALQTQKHGIKWPQTNLSSHGPRWFFKTLFILCCHSIRKDTNTSALLGLRWNTKSHLTMMSLIMLITWLGCNWSRSSPYYDVIDHAHARGAMLIETLRSECRWLRQTSSFLTSWGKQNWAKKN